MARYRSCAQDRPLWAASLFSGGVALAESLRPSLERRHLDKSAEILVYPCERGFAWFYDSGTLESCRTARDSSFGEARVPAGSWIHLTSDGNPRFVFLHHDTCVNNFMCRGEGHRFATNVLPQRQAAGMLARREPRKPSETGVG